jgi:hypothetical protein
MAALDAVQDMLGLAVAQPAGNRSQLVGAQSRYRQVQRLLQIPFVQTEAQERSPNGSECTHD